MGKEPRAGEAPNGGELSFVVYNPSHASSGSSNMMHDARHVRSHAAKRGWTGRKRKSSSASHKAPGRAQHQGSSQTQSPNQGLHCTCRSSSSRAAARNAQCTCVTLASESPQSSPPPVQEKSGRDGRSGRKFLEVVLIEDFPLWPTLGNASGPITIPVSWKPAFGPLMDFWLNRLGPLYLNEIDHGWDESEIHAFSRMAFELSIASPEPMAFYATMGLAASQLPKTHPLALRNAPRLSHILQNKATQALSTAMQDPERAKSNLAMLSVLFLVGQAFFIGQTDLAKRMYMPILRRMTELRGGISTIASEGVEGYMFARWLAWGDRIYASNVGVETIFLEFEDRTVKNTDWGLVTAQVEKRKYDLFQRAEAEKQRKARRQ